MMGYKTSVEEILFERAQEEHGTLAATNTYLELWIEAAKKRDRYYLGLAFKGLATNGAGIDYFRHAINYFRELEETPYTNSLLAETHFEYAKALIKQQGYGDEASKELDVAKKYAGGNIQLLHQILREISYHQSSIDRKLAHSIELPDPIIDPSNLKKI